MKKSDCPNEDAIRRAAGLPEPDPELARHLASCRPCRNSHRVAAWLGAVASSPAPHRQLPHPSQLWWKAEIIRKMTAQQEMVERVSRPTLWGSGVALGALLASFTVAMTGLPASVGTGLAGPGWLLAMGVAVAPMAALTAFWLIWRES